MADREIPASTGDFRLMDRAVVEALKALPERNRFMKGLFAWVGFRQVGVPYVRPRARRASSSAYRRLFRFALDGMTSLLHRAAADLDRCRRGLAAIFALLARRSS